MDGVELAFISQKMLSFLPRYEIYREGELFATLAKEFSWFKKKFSLDVPGPNDYEITGSFWLHDYEFKRRGAVVAVVSKAVWTWSDTYGVDIADGEPEIPILCAALAIDQILHDEQRS